ncbi:solute carrier family 46 member 3 [Oncorhynchus tshawytscha]|uniref:solute carrier family 46 member 3 n=1 Tax=Oncorhynchus tshawytscha TaxID=74940 RepID=UPI001C3E32E6|nr:solute carrier family 46 member 3 [Oncorhynchus tshawytscha]XP_042167565.1 solute carrier family 46 member 3 [Oncorhynchus tshawytscha]
MMVRVFLIEPVVGFYAFSMFMLYPLIQQYVYRRLWQQLTGAPYPTQMNYTHCSDSSTNVSSIHQEIQKETSLFLFYSELCFLFPSLLSSLLLVSYSDHRGRKVSKLGGMSIFILYELNAPLCWSEVLVGYGSALSTLIYLGSFAGVSLLSLSSGRVYSTTGTAVCRCRTTDGSLRQEHVAHVPSAAASPSLHHACSCSEVHDVQDSTPL